MVYQYFIYMSKKFEQQLYLCQFEEKKKQWNGQIIILSLALIVKLYVWDSLAINLSCDMFTHWLTYKYMMTKTMIAALQMLLGASSESVTVALQIFNKKQIQSFTYWLTVMYYVHQNNIWNIACHMINFESVK